MLARFLEAGADKQRGLGETPAKRLNPVASQATTCEDRPWEYVKIRTEGIDSQKNRGGVWI